jgi:hypothetical protein
VAPAPATVFSSICTVAAAHAARLTLDVQDGFAFRGPLAQADDSAAFLVSAAPAFVVNQQLVSSCKETTSLLAC